MLRDIAFLYFAAFQAKDVTALRRLFSHNVKLSDWEITADGIDAVIEANIKIFNACESIEVRPLNIYIQDRTVVSELYIVINQFEIIKVVDILEFTADSKIVEIRAFKG